MLSFQIPRLHVIGAIVCSFVLFHGQAIAQQQDWSNTPPTYTTLPPQSGAVGQSPQATQQPFANPPQRFNAPQAQPQNQFQNQAVPQPVFQAAATPIAAESEPIVAESSEVKPPSADDVAAGLAKEAKEAKNTVTSAFLRNDRDSQVKLATKYLLPIATIMFVLFAANWLGSYFRNSVSRIVSRRVDVTLGRFSGTVTKTLVVLSAVAGVLMYYGFEMTSLAALVAAFGFAVGMALQGTLGNFASGIALLVFRPFNVGDYIVIDDSEGTVQAIDLFTTSIDTADNRRIILPNESVFGNRIVNLTHNATRRVDVMVGVSYSADMKQTRRVLLDALAGVQGAIPTPSPVVYLSELNASSVDWSCRVWCSPAEYMAVKERVTEAAKEALDRNGIGIPFPQLDLHVVSPNIQQKAAA